MAGQLRNHPADSLRDLFDAVSEPLEVGLLVVEGDAVRAHPTHGREGLLAHDAVNESDGLKDVEDVVETTGGNLVAKRRLQLDDLEAVFLSR